MKHLFDVDIAIEYGVHSAILLENIGYWVKQNEANQTNFHNGKYWTFNSRRAYQELFPYMSKRQIETAFEKLISNGLIVTGNYNTLAYDRTLWYALTQKGKSILHFGEMDFTKRENALHQNVSPIPSINTNINTDVNADINNISNEFEILWKIYPRKIGKPKALKAYTKARKKGVSFDDVKKGIENYNDEIKTKKTATEYIKHGATWFIGECWNDEYEQKKISPYAHLKVHTV